jgi:nitroreductase
MYKSLTDDMVRRIADAAAAAPSIHNTQPWRLRVTGDLIEIHGDPDRMLWVADPKGRALRLSCGAALFDIRLAIRVLGAKPLVWPLPDPRGEPTLLASVLVEEGRPPTAQEREMFEAIQLRHSSRVPYSDRPIPDQVQIGLEREAAAEFAVLRMLSARDTAAVLKLTAAAEEKLAANFDHQVELASWVATTGDDGIPASALGEQPEQGPAPVRDFARTSPRTVLPVGHFERLPQLGVLSTARDEPGDWLRAGQALQRVLLAATGHGIATSMLYQPIELHDMEQTAGDAGRAVGDWWLWPENPQIIVRFGYGSPGPGTPRRPMSEVLDWSQ